MNTGLAHTLRHHDGAPLLCFDYLHYARRLFGTGEKRWFDGVQLLNLFRQAQQALKVDVILFPLLDWMIAWRSEETAKDAVVGSPAKALRAICSDLRLVAALSDVIAALATLNRSGTKLAFVIDDPARWLAWAGGTNKCAEVLDEADAEDVAVYLSALLHQLAMNDVAGLFLRQDTPLDGDAGMAYAPLTNTARHYGLASVLCAPVLEQMPEGFDSYATQSRTAKGGYVLVDDEWSVPQALPAGSPFAIGIFPEAAPPEKLLATLEYWRSRTRTR